MIIVRSTETLDIVKIEDIKKWCEYSPSNYIENTSDKKKNLSEKDNLILSYIELIYKLLKITENDKSNHNFKIGQLSYERYKEYKETINNIYILFNINEEATLKLNRLEIKQCIEISKSSMSSKNSINNISNFYIKSYTEFLIFIQKLLKEEIKKEKIQNKKLKKFNIKKLKRKK